MKLNLEGREDRYYVTRREGCEPVLIKSKTGKDIRGVRFLPLKNPREIQELHIIQGRDPWAVGNKREVNALEHFFHSVHHYNWHNEGVYGLKYKEDYEEERRLSIELGATNLIEYAIIKHVSIYEFFNYVGFDYKRKKWLM